MAKYLVTGGAGFIGSNFLSLLLKNDDYVVCLDKFTYAATLWNMESLKGAGNLAVVKGDMADWEMLDRVWTDPFDYVVNFAAESHVDRSINAPNSFYATNVLGTLNLLNKCLQHPPKLFIQISTDEVYGSIPKPRLASERSRLNPSNPYSASKGSADLTVLAYHKTYKLPTVILRAVNNFGPRQYPEKLIPKAIIRALKGEVIPIYGDGQAVRTWLYVEDFCKAVFSAIERGVPGEIYNIGSKAEITNLELVKLILQILGAGEDLIELVSDRPGHDKRYALDYAVATRELGWQPTYCFRKALAETVAWYEQHFLYYANLQDQYL